MIVLSREEMQRLDRYTIDELGIPGRVLMESAGAGCAHYIMENHVDSVQKILILCGVGNNGGDGLVIARWLHSEMMNVRVFLFGDPTKMSPETQANYELCEKLDISIHPIKKKADWDKLDELWENADLMVDAIFGIGFKAPIKGWMADVIEEINDQQLPMIAIDIPSGLDAETGAAGVAIEADVTLTMDFPKYGHYLGQGREFCGKVVEIDIGIPTQLHWQFPARARITDEHTLVLPARKPTAHKGEYGRIGIIAGSQGYSGAAILASRAALRAGAGLITLFHPAGMETIFESQLVEVMKCAVSLTDKNLPDWDVLLPRLAMQDVLLIGPGLGFSTPAEALVEYLCRQWEGPLVIDADALTHLSMHPEWLKSLAEKTVLLTPHVGEFARLTGTKPDTILSDPLGELEKFWKKYKVAVLLKSATSIYYGGDQFIFNTTGNDGLATGGSGDVLGGIIASFIGQGLSIEDAAPAGSYVMGATAETLATTRDTAAIIPSDIIEQLFVLSQSEAGHTHDHEH